MKLYILCISRFLTGISAQVGGGVTKQTCRLEVSRLRLAIAGALCFVANTASGSLILDSTSNADPASTTVTISNLNTTPTAASTGLTFTSSGTVAGASNLSPSDSFMFTIDAVSGWTDTDALAAASTFDTYLSALTDFDLGTIGDGSFAPRNPLGSNDTTFGAGEALVFTFDTTSLTTPAAELTLESFVTTLDGGVDVADFFVWDSDTSSFLEQQVGVNADNVGNGQLDIGPLTTNDIFVIAANSRNESTWRVDSFEFGVTAVPEPSTTVVLMSLVASGFFVRRRRKLVSQR